MENQTEQQSKSLLIVYTGDGKGKTTAALGMCLRAIGHDWHVCVIQFIKGTWKYGEIEGLKRLGAHIELNIVGEGCVGIMNDRKDFEEHRQAARNGVKLAIEKIRSNGYELVVLDELNVAVDLGLVTDEEVEELLEARGSRLHMVITGRNAREWLIERADLVTEMKEVKHPFQKGVLAKKGIDW
ncbi:MAG: cob(I)yrinic acid a,c-diamide adenosyltransferase [candidate division Zixibacteria bacterium]|nr:cob(I)yrinic acid a,c-diamide adenosyltransferase [candidate division Zixibacteria bacterium]